LLLSVPACVALSHTLSLFLPLSSFSALCTECTRELFAFITVPHKHDITRSLTARCLCTEHTHRTHSLPRSAHTLRPSPPVSAVPCHACALLTLCTHSSPMPCVYCHAHTPHHSAALYTLSLLYSSLLFPALSSFYTRCFPCKLFLLQGCLFKVGRVRVCLYVHWSVRSPGFGLFGLCVNLFSARALDWVWLLCPLCLCPAGSG
ncbi:hypothetical protein NEIRO02_2554, partial [Nematocida sp. AWRm79]